MKTNEILGEKWSAKYKRSIDCNNPKGFSQRAHCDSRKKNEAVQQELPVDIARINIIIDRFESTGNIPPESADKMRRGIQSLSSDRQTIYPLEILQLLTALSS